VKKVPEMSFKKVSTGGKKVGNSREKSRLLIVFTKKINIILIIKISAIFGHPRLCFLLKAES
jgi:hypothetical protein